MTVKESLLKIFEESGGRELSGQTLADKLNVSRTAVWKGINSLNSDGYRIEAEKGKGYRLLDSGDLLSAERIRLYLPEELRENEIKVLKTVDSTNTFAKKQAADGAKNGTLIISEEQTCGRGRRGNSFYSPSGTGLYMSLILNRALDGCDADLITICAGCAVCLAIEELTEKSPLIKWVNDVYANGKKLCGILAESALGIHGMEYVVLGIGVNVKQTAFPASLSNKAISLEEAGAPEADLNRLAAEILNALSSFLEGEAF